MTKSYDGRSPDAYTFNRPLAFAIGEELTRCKFWYEVLVGVCNAAYKHDQVKFDDIAANDPKLSRSLFRERRPKPWIKTKKVKGSKWWVQIVFDADDAMNLCCDIISRVGLPKGKFRIWYYRPRVPQVNEAIPCK